MLVALLAIPPSWRWVNGQDGGRYHGNTHAHVAEDLQAPLAAPMRYTHRIIVDTHVIGIATCSWHASCVWRIAGQV